MMLRYLEQTTNFFGSWAPVIQLLKSYVFLKKTLKLSNEDIIGSGEYGTIYILTQDDTMALAVKRLNRGSADRDRRFEREIEAMGDIKHRNIVTLRPCLKGLGVADGKAADAGVRRFDGWSGGNGGSVGSLVDDFLPEQDTGSVQLGLLGFHGGCRPQYLDWVLGPKGN
ncbi:probable receptor-like serine/threonine-protein kinase At4g34500 [Rosa rugosa]|uniref:probable receptor-like serine/threonine-protein kinase At4g34500 n=1 Tax=Rosa rugosa TaxID=74645 RepID=UPI002B4014D3|nr:probable receptor-like serine/threonine-protein kinase At4g34500 [Rosa rugosa]